ncbi:MAG TPA: FAD-dependent oxidoreductase [Candidatus Binatia bacterium]|nr:FAD-dependent oxidoreductase [Candidatus Binatia bacterium]
MNRAEPVDIAIVGGGISGLYCFLQLALAMRTKKPLKCLNNRHPSSIGLYESTNRFGGRIETWSFNYSDPKTPPTQADETFHAEFGPMRIEPTHQPLLKDLLDYLGIKESDDPKDHRGLVKFPAYSADDPEEPRFKLEGEEAEQKSLLDLLLLAVRRICELVVEEPADLIGGARAIRLQPSTSASLPREVRFAAATGRGNYVIGLCPSTTATTISYGRKSRSTTFICATWVFGICSVKC